MNYTGDNGTIKLGVSGVTPLLELTGFSIDETAEAIQTNTMDGSCSSDYEVGVIGWSGSIDVHYDPADPGALLLAPGLTVDVDFHPLGDVIGSPSIQGSAIITSLGNTIERDAMVTSTYNLQGKGLLVRAPIP